MRTMDEVDAGMSLGDKARALLDAFPAAYWQALAVVMALYLVGAHCRAWRWHELLAPWPAGGSVGVARSSCAHAWQEWARTAGTHFRSSCHSCMPFCALQARFDVAFITLHASAVRRAGERGGVGMAPCAAQGVGACAPLPLSLSIAEGRPNARLHSTWGAARALRSCPPRPPPYHHDAQVMDKARIPTLTFFSMAPVVALVRGSEVGQGRQDDGCCSGMAHDKWPGGLPSFAACNRSQA